ncbi:valine--tRNA ligase [Terrihabitans soli]|uniref:Valine--tRNA ligase n=1 Tax=Terrihabitans soli TaxID=708113 RepID=A0A6S6QSU1_9HYPH|nr:valine--tRNA ligase [Terrihabitans soli]BCJ90685.1 valine--tRNA ligase [Terrihabitans soli]
MTIEKTYDPSEIEGRISAAWNEAGAFKAGANAKPGAEAFSIVIPPPNVTGSLHMGHALNNTLQDVLTRYMRMRGNNVLWQPGTDHAGIATQMVVERQLMERQEPNRRAMGREKFLERVWAWKEESGGTIINQLKRLGASADFSRERFTMDEGLSRAVLKVFVDLHRKGLIYKDKRLVNWDPALRTAISDLEVETREVKGHMWHFAYPLKDGPVDGLSEIVIATTRPETMLGDGAVAVHPSDERYKNLIGKLVRLPVAERYIPIIADEYPDPEFGSGAVKITGAHDFNDFEVAKRNDIPMYSLMDADAKMAGEYVPERFRGMDRFEARKKVVAEIEAEGLLRQIEDKVIAQPFGDRSGVVIEPYLTDQWYVDAHTLAQPALQAVRDGRTQFVPKNWEKTYFEWLENIQPWCISRQLWWGHQIPAWYGPDGHVFVEMSEADAEASAQKHYGKAVELTRDEDVLDTWFSSALWPFSTMGWPDKTPELKAYYPTSVLVTGFDIIFFWVARMMMMGLEFMGEVPFKDVYIHALVRDEKGAKMSKSKGNVIDPLELMDEYGADAVRFTLAAMAAQGRDIKLAKQRIEGYRNFATKLWNAARFAEMNQCKVVPDFDPAKAKAVLNRWIIGETNKTVTEIDAALASYRFNEAAGAAYRFVWSIFCDWYLELAKPVLQTETASAERDETRATVSWALDQIVKLLHPFMPFITEELWALNAPAGGRSAVLAMSDWPLPAGGDTSDAEAEIGWLVDLISEVRSVRTEMNVPGGAQIPLLLIGAPANVKEWAGRYQDALKRLARLSEIGFADAPPAGAVQVLVRGGVAALPVADVVDLAAEKTRLAKEIAKITEEVEKIDKKLGNPDFLSRAKEEVIEEQRERREEAEARRIKLSDALERLKGVA